MRALAALAVGLVAASLSASAAAEERYAIVIGHNLGARGELPLRYAEADAEKVASVFQEIGGVRAENLVLLRGPDPAALRSAIVSVNERIRRRRPEETSLFVYYSGHADAKDLHLGDGTVPVDELRGLVEGSSAGFRVLILDACRSGGLTKVKGGRVVPTSAMLFRDEVPGEGMVFLAATAANEDAQESESIRGSFFTHYFVTALLGAGDADQDGAVDLNEAYRFAYDNTIRASSRSLAGTQHPTFRQTLKGKGDIVITRWNVSAARAFLRFPQDQEWFVMRGSSGGAIIAEISAETPVRTISVGPGRYFLRGRGPKALEEATVELRAGQTTDVELLPMERTDYARLVRKGGDRAPRVSHGMHAGYSFRAAVESDGPLCHGAYAGYSADLPRISLQARFLGCKGGFDLGASTGDSNELGFELRVHRYVDLRPLTLDFGVGIGPSWIRQNFAGAFVTGVEFTAESRTGLALHADFTFGLRRDIKRGFYAAIEGAAMVYLLRRDSAGGSSNLESTFVPRFGVSLGKQF